MRIWVTCIFILSVLNVFTQFVSDEDPNVVQTEDVKVYIDPETGRTIL